MDRGQQHETVALIAFSSVCPGWEEVPISASKEANPGVPADSLISDTTMAQSHGAKASAAHTVATEISEGDALLNYADDIGADLIVAGGYGHSRQRELAFGGVTRTLLMTMTVPVFLSH